MAGLYIHIPFCKSRCIYCAFYSTVDSPWKQRYVEAVCREMTLRSQGPTRPQIETVYLGGGTPSQLSIEQLEQLFQHIRQTYDVAATAEVTMEMNPDDVTREYAEALVQMGVNRVSMGVQTFHEQRLQFLHRRHTAAQIPQAVNTLRTAGISNISIDLMYGFPEETLSDWQHDIDEALALDVEHISAYCLMIEEGTPLYKQLHKRDGSFCVVCDEELERTMYEMLIDRLTAAGYEHYEISNFARQGRRSRHNSSYWHDIPYIGLGAAAHSYDGCCRSWNVADIHQYIEAIERGELPSEQEVIDDDTHYNDRITTALRTSDGLNLTTLTEHHRRHCMKEARRFVDDGLLRLTDDQRLVLTRKGLFVSDYVMSELMMV